MTGLSRPMIEYLKRHGFLWPAYSPDQNPRGRVRYYSYRNLVVARLIQHLREGGVQLGRLKSMAERLSHDSFWAGGQEPPAGLEWVVSDGQTVDLQDGPGIIQRMSGGERSSFAFVVHVGRLRDEVRERIPSDKRSHFSMAVEELKFAGIKAAGAPPHA